MKVYLKCPACGYKWHWNYWKWVLKAPFHMFLFTELRDYRKTKCPSCKERLWMYRVK